MLDEAYKYLSSSDCPALTVLADSIGGTTTTATRQRMVEFILVDDGSKDQTVQVYQQFVASKQSSFLPSPSHPSTKQNISFRLVRLRQNRGKGAAVQAGMLTAVGHFCLMVDADGATAFEPGLVAVANRISAYDLVLGSRANLDKAVLLQRSRVRQFLQGCFHFVVVLLVGHADIQDTQCGFKLFRGRHVRALFGNLHLRRWAFDTELLYRATGLRIAEVAVPWHEVAGSKLNTGPFALLRVAVDMLRDMLCVRLCYTLRLWKLPPRPPASKQD
jgi:dolichyl-phosphate beta-glucosyltransferase